MLAGLLDTVKGLPKEVKHVEPNPELEKLQLQLVDVKKKMRREVGFLRALYDNDEERRSDMAKMPEFRATLEVEPDLYGFVKPVSLEQQQQEQQKTAQHYAVQLLLFRHQQQQIGVLQHLVRQREEEQRSVQNKRSFSQYSSSDKHYSSHRKNARIY